MKAVANVLLSVHQPEVKITHKEETITFSVNVFGRNNFTVLDYDVFEHINKYWNQLPQIKQDLIFKIYKDIQMGFDSVFTTTDLSEFLSNKVKELMDLHELVDIKDFLAMKTDVVIPNTFTTEYTHSVDNNTSREKTYTQNDYMQLITLSTVLRCMIPIWGEYINNIRREIGNDFKEIYAFQLLNKSGLIKSLPVEKLKTYIEHIAGDDKSNANNTLNNIASEDHSYWLLSLVCIRRLCLGDIRGLDPKTNLITFVYKSIIQKIKGIDANTEDNVKLKLMDDRGATADDKTSSLERYKITTDLSPEDIVELEYSIDNIRAVSTRLCLDIDSNLLNRSLYTSKELENKTITIPQIMLLSWIMKPVISPRGLLYLNKNKIVEAIGAAEAILWSRGHKYLALLISSYSIDTENTMLLSPVDSKAKIDPLLLTQLEELYPNMELSNKKTVKSPNFAIQSLDKLINNLVVTSWKPTADVSLIKGVFGTEMRRIPILPDIKNIIARLIIEVANKNWI